MRILILHNPRAGRNRITKAHVVRAFVRAGHVVRYRSLRSRGWKRVRWGAADVVAVVGGDGAVADVARALARRRAPVPLVIIPTGTANNVARALGIASGRGLTRFLADLDNAARSRLAVGVARGPWGAARFVESAGVGVMASLIAKDPPTPWRGIAHVRRALHTADPRPLRVRADGADLSGDYVMVLAMNVGMVGPRLAFAPEADPTDEELDLVLVRPADVAGLRRYLGARARGLGAGPCPVAALRARRIEIAPWPGSGGGNVDDSLWPDGGARKRGTVRIRIEARIRVLVPRPPREPFRVASRRAAPPPTR